MSFNVNMALKTASAGGIAGKAGHDRVAGGTRKGLMKALALVERHHKTKEWRSGVAGRLRDVAPHPDLLTVRTGMLKRSYTRELAENLLRASYGSDLVYAPVHEHGSPIQNIRQRPTLERTAKATAAAVEKILADNIAREF
jgi:hypothetical protein